MTAHLVRTEGWTCLPAGTADGLADGRGEDRAKGRRRQDQHVGRTFFDQQAEHPTSEAPGAGRQQSVGDAAKNTPRGALVVFTESPKALGTGGHCDFIDLESILTHQA